MKKRWISLVCVILLVVSLLCGCSSQPTAAVSSADSPEALVNAIIQYIRNDCRGDISGLFDHDAFIAYMFQEVEGMFGLFTDSADFAKARSIVKDFNKGADYLQKTYPDFAARWQGNKNEPLTDETLSRIIERVKESPLDTPEKIAKEWSEFKILIPDDFAYNAENLYSYDPYCYQGYDANAAYYEYSIPLDYKTTEKLVGKRICAMDIYFYENQGRYYAFLVNETVGGGEGG